MGSGRHDAREINSTAEDVPPELAHVWALLSHQERVMAQLLVDAVADGLLDDPAAWDRYRAAMAEQLRSVRRGEQSALDAHAEAMRSAGVL